METKVCYLLLLSAVLLTLGASIATGERLSPITTELEVRSKQEPKCTVPRKFVDNHHHHHHKTCVKTVKEAAKIFLNLMLEQAEKMDAVKICRGFRSNYPDMYTMCQLAVNGIDVLAATTFIRHRVMHLRTKFAHWLCRMVKEEDASLHLMPQIPCSSCVRIVDVIYNVCGKLGCNSRDATQTAMDSTCSRSELSEPEKADCVVLVTNNRNLMREVYNMDEHYNTTTERSSAVCRCTGMCS